MSAQKKWPLMWRLRLTSCLAGVIFLPASIGTVQLCLGVDPTALVNQKWLLALMLIPVITRILVILPAVMAILCVCTMAGEILMAAKEGRMEWPASLTALATTITCTGLVSLEVFYWALMGV